jgi:hypothetical protein
LRTELLTDAHASLGEGYGTFANSAPIGSIPSASTSAMQAAARSERGMCRSTSAPLPSGKAAGQQV